MTKTKTDRRSTPVAQALDPEVIAFRQQFEERSPLDQLVREGAQKMLQEAINAELETFIAEEPGDIATLARSVTAETLAHQRSIVLQRLRRMGVDVIEAPWDKIGYQLIDRYFIIKNSEAIG